MKHLAKKIAFVAISFFGVCQLTYSHGNLHHEEESRFVKVYFKNIDQGRDIAAAFEPFESDYSKGYLILNIGPDEIRHLDRYGVEYELDLETEARHRDAVRAIELKLYENQKDGIPGFPCYRTVEETLKSGEDLVKKFPKLASYVKIGESHNKKSGAAKGYDLKVLILTNKDTKGDKPKLFLTSAIHAREYTTAELVTRFMEGLANDYGKDPDVTWMLDHQEVHALLQTNPDGRKVAEERTMKRKNENAKFCSNSRLAKGVDLNRNFHFKWGGTGSSGNQCSDTYRGDKKGSESESSAVMDYMDKLFKDARGPADSDKAPLDTPGTYIDVHSSGRLVLYAWGHTKDDSPNNAGLQALGRKYAFYNDHAPQKGIGLYATTGTTSDHAYGKLGVAGFTYELGTTFHEKCSYFEESIVKQNIDSLRYAFKAVRAPYKIAHGPNVIGVSLSESLNGYTINATADDTQFNNSKGTEATQNIAAAELYIETPPWAGGKPIEMKASDGTFDSKKETISGTIEKKMIPIYKKKKDILVYVRAKDQSGSWGAFSSAFIKSN